MALDALLREILVDPEDKQSLWYFDSDALLYNPRLRRSYPIRDGIPVLLIGEASAVDDETHAGFEARLGEAVVTGGGPAA
jgi:uncharacterized protein YbaR (Trm112 family)